MYVRMYVCVLSYCMRKNEWYDTRHTLICFNLVTMKNIIYGYIRCMYSMYVCTVCMYVCKVIVYIKTNGSVLETLPYALNKWP